MYLSLSHSYKQTNKQTHKHTNKHINTCVGTYLFSYNKVDNKPAKASGLISRFSWSLYKLHFIVKVWQTLSTSVANPVRPTYSFSFIRNTFSKYFVTVCACIPKRKSIYKEWWRRRRRRRRRWWWWRWRKYCYYYYYCCCYNDYMI